MALAAVVPMGADDVSLLLLSLSLWSSANSDAAAAADVVASAPCTMQSGGVLARVHDSLSLFHVVV